jgi:perosamine synthetase
VPAHGAEFKGRKVGSFGDISCFSFYGNKIITTGEGGMCLTNNEELAENMRILRDHGMNPNRRYWYDVIGFNYRMTNLQAAIGVAQLKKLDEFVEKKREIARWYSEGLKDFEDKFDMSRDDLMKRLEEKGIETRPFFYPMHVMPPYENNGKFHVAEEISRKGFNLPSGVNLTQTIIEEIVNITEEVAKCKNL